MIGKGVQFIAPPCVARWRGKLGPVASFRNVASRHFTDDQSDDHRDKPEADQAEPEGALASAQEAPTADKIPRDADHRDEQQRKPEKLSDGDLLFFRVGITPPQQREVEGERVEELQTQLTRRMGQTEGVKRAM